MDTKPDEPEPAGPGQSSSESAPAIMPTLESNVSTRSKILQADNMDTKSEEPKPAKADQSSNASASSKTLQTDEMDTTPDESKPAKPGQSSNESAPAVKPDNRMDPKHHSVTVRSFNPVYDESGQNIRRFEDHSKQLSYHAKVVSEGYTITKHGTSTRLGDPKAPCYLDRLPLHLRYRIWEELFKHDGSPLEIGRLKRTPIANLAILRVSHSIYHEASIALYHSLSYRLLFLRTYGSFTADILRWTPKPLRACGKTAFGSRFDPPCLIHKLKWQRPYKSIVMLLGSTDFKRALQRRWSFSEFITTLRMYEPLHVYDLGIVATENWKMPGFNEKDLVKALFSGAFVFLGELRFKGFTEKECDRIRKLIFALKKPDLKIEREKKRIKGPGFSPLICK